jgi:CBS domain-containing protein
MNVGQIFQREVDVASSDESAQAAAQRMAARNVGSLVVTDEAEHPVGIVTDRDVALKVVGRALSALDTTVEEIMTKNPVCVGHGASADEALSTMARKGVRRLPVTDSGGRLIGMLSFDDVLLGLTQELATARLLLQKESPRSLATGA